MSQNNTTTWLTDREHAISVELEKPSSRYKERDLQTGNDLPVTYPVPLENNQKRIRLPVYKINIQTVNFNFDNVRVKKYIAAKCRELGVTKLNQELPEHQKVMQEILLTTKSYSAVKSASLKEDLAKFGQEDPALITPEGILYNGNRRVAAMRDFFENGFTSSKEDGQNVTAGNSDWKELLVCVLRKPNGDPLDADELRSLEKRLQNKKPTKEEYGDINDSIDIRDAFSKKFDIYNLYINLYI